MLFAPFLAKIAEGLSKKGYLIGLAVMAFFMLEFYKFPYGFTYKNGYGTSLLFFVLLFYIGGYYRKYENLIPLKVLHLKNNRQLFLAIVVLVSLYGGMRGICFGELKAILSTTPYHSFTFIVSVVLFQYFLDIKFKETKFTKFCCFISPYTFAVYLIHDNNYVRDWLWHDVIHLENTLNTPYYILLLAFIPLSIYIVCLGIEYLRVKIFDVIGLTSFLRKINFDIKVW